MIELRILGTPQIAANGQAQDLLAQPKRLALLSYLACPSPGTVHRRDTLLALFWPEFPDDRARAALRKTLYHLRRALGADVLIANGDDNVALNAHRIRTDLDAFHTAIEAEDYPTALQLYRDDLLAGFFLADAPAFEEWQERTRATARTTATEAAWRLAERERDSGNGIEAARWGRRALALSGLDESALQRVMRLLDELGDRAGALNEYHAFARRMESEWDAAPSPKTRQLHDRMKAGDSDTSVPIRATAMPATPTGGRSVATNDRKLASRPGEFAGRWSRRQWLFAALLLGFASLGALIQVDRGSDRVGVPRLAVAAYDNQTGDPSLGILGQIYADRTARALAWAGSIPVTSPYSTLFLSPIPSQPSGGSERASPTRNFAEATQATVIVWGTMTRASHWIRFETHITDMTSGTTFHLPVDSAPSDDQLRAAKLIRGHVASTLDSALDLRSTSATPVPPPPPYAAYRAFVMGFERLFRDMNVREADSLLTEAAKLDPSFVTPALHLAMIYVKTGSAERADSILRELGYPVSASRWSTWDQLWSDVVYHRSRRDHTRAYRSLGALRGAVPTDGFVMAEFVREAYASGHYNDVISVLDATTPDQVPSLGYWTYLADALHAVGQYDRERQVADAAQKRGNPEALSAKFRARALIAVGDVAGLQDLLDRAEQEPNPRPRGWLASWVGTELMLHGHTGRAKEFLQRAIDSYDRNARDTTLGRAGRMDLAEVLYFTGRYVEARLVYHELLEYVESNAGPNGRGVNLHTRLWTLGRLGAIAAQLDFPEAARRYDSLIASSADDPHRALAALQRAVIWHHLGNTQASGAHLRDAVAAGFRVPDLHYYETDLPPLDSVLPRPLARVSVQ